MSAHASALLGALRDAGEDGLPESRVKELGGRYWEAVLRRLCRWHTISEWHGVYYLTNGVEGSHGESYGSAPLGAMAALSTEGQLVLLDVPGSSHYDLDRAA